MLQEEDCDQVKTLLWTALHWAAASDQVGLQEIQTLLHFGALKSLKTGMDETPYDIAVRKNRPVEILAELQLPPAVTENKEVIENIKTVAHKIIEERVGDKIKENGMQLPQIQILWEISNECGKQKHRTVAENYKSRCSLLAAGQLLIGLQGSLCCTRCWGCAAATVSTWTTRRTSCTW